VCWVEGANESDLCLNMPCRENIVSEVMWEVLDIPVLYIRGAHDYSSIQHGSSPDGNRSQYLISCMSKGCRNHGLANVESNLLIKRTWLLSLIL